MADKINNIIYNVEVDTKSGKVSIDGLTKGFLDADRAVLKLQNDLSKNTKGVDKFTNRLDGASKAAGASTSATLELGRVLSDMPYGIRGVANNLQQLGSNLFFMSKKTDDVTGKMLGFKGAVGSVLKGLIGPAGILIAFQGVIALLDYFSTNTKKVKDGTVDAEKATKDFSSELKSLEKTLSDSGVSQDNYNQKIRDYILLKKQQKALDKEIVTTQSKIDDKNKEIQNTLDDDIKLNERLTQARKDAADEAVRIYPDTRIGRQAKAQAKDYSATISEIESRLRSNITHRKELEDDIVQLHVDQLKKIKAIEDAKDELGAAEEGTLKALKDQRKELERKRELEAKTPLEYKKQSIAIEKLTKQIEYIEGLKKKGSGKTKSISPFATPKELDIDIKNGEAALLRYDKQIQDARSRKEFNDKLSEAKSEEERKKIREEYQLKKLQDQLDFEKKMLDLKMSTEKAMVKTKTKNHIDELKRKHTEFVTELSHMQSLKKISKEDADKERLKADNILFDGVVQANKEEIKSIKEVENKYTSLMSKLIELGLVRKASVISGFGGEDSELTKMEKFAEKFNAISSYVTEFMDAEFTRQLTIEQNKTNALNNELRERLNNENLSAGERKNIQLQIARNDEALRKKQEKIEKKRFKMQKAANISQALIATYLSAQKAYLSQLQLDPTAPIRAKIAAGVATAIGLGNVAMIARQKFQSSAGATVPAGALGSGGGSGSGTGDRSFNFNLAGASRENQLAQTLQGRFDQPLQAYVVSRDITNQQQLDMDIQNNASFG